MSTLSDGRKRQTRRDEAIRKKIAADLERKRGGTPKRPDPPQSRGSATPGNASRRGAGGVGGSSSARQAGTVSALRPTPALTVPQHISVADASQLCAAKRTDCVLVVDDDEHLCGIFTAKDLAFRVVGEGLDPRNTPVSQIMTPNPMVTRDTTSATDALQTMVQKHFRHLPVCNEEGDVVGLLDITKVFHESLEKLERAYGSSQKLYSALEGVQSEWGPNNSGGFGGAHGLMSYVEALREKMSFPDLGSILDARTRAVTVSVKTSVREAAKLMRDNRTTAVCVVEDGGKLAGIFTSKDVVLRVIAAGLEARTCSVVRVMTPHPDTGLPTLSIQQALRKMNDGRFLNLPVLEEDGTLVGCVDVLKLTYATLEQVSSIGAEAGGDAAGGPLWSRFFSSFAGAAADGDTESVVSDTNAPSSINNGTPSAVPRHMQRGDSQYTNGSTSPSEIHPNDSASVNNDEDEVSEIGRRANGSKPGTSAVASGVGKATVPEHDDGTYLFKFISPSGTTHRFVARHDNFSTVRDIIGGKLSSDPFFVQYNSTRGAETGVIADPSEFMISYTDDDGDVVLMSADGDLEDSVKTARKQGKDRVLLTIKGGKDWDAAITNAAEQQALQQEAALKRQPLVPPTVQVHDHDATSTDDDDEKTKVNRSLGEKPRGKSAPRKSWVQGGDDLVLGFLSKEMVLPAAVVFTGFAVIAVFLLNRPTQK